MRLLKKGFFLVALPLSLIGVWSLATLGSDNFFFPAPGKIGATFGDVWTAERLRADVLPSLTRLLVGLAIATVLGIAAGVVIGASWTLRALTEPVLEFFRAVPPPILVPILMLLVGINDQMKILVIISGCIWPILLNTVEGVRAVDEVLSDTCRVYRISGRQRITALVLPAASPQIMAGIRQALSVGLILMVISEMFASSSGLGFTIVQFQRAFAVPEMWSGILLLGLIGILLALLFTIIQRRILRWYHGLREVDNAS